MAYPLITEKQTFWTAADTLASGALLFVYLAGTTTKVTTHKETDESSQNTNPIVLNSRGEVPNGLYVAGGAQYKLVLAPSTDSDPPAAPIWTRDELTPINDTTITVSEWQASGYTPTYVSATSFTVTGDRTSIFQVGRRVKTTNTGGTIYGTITVSAYTSLTTVTVANDSGSLDSGLSAVEVGLLTANNTGVPVLPDTMPIRPGVRIETGAISVGTTRVWTAQNKDITVAGTADIVLALGKYISGFTMSNNSGDATNDIDIGAGVGIDDAQTTWIGLSSSITKRLDAVWSVGTGNGGLDTGSIANAWYHVWAIMRSDTSVVDVLFSTSASSPTMPANYDKKRLIGSIYRTGGAIKAFDQKGDYFAWKAPVADVSAGNIADSRTLRTLTVPTGRKVKADFTYGQYTDGSANPINVWIGDPDVTDAAVGNLGSNFRAIFRLANSSAFANLQIYTNTSAQIADRTSSGNSINSNTYYNTHGWIDPRGTL